MSRIFDTVSICCGRPGLRAGVLALAVVLSGCTLPPGGLAQVDGSASAQALQQAEQQGYAQGFAAGELAQALRDKAREAAEGPEPPPAASPAPAAPAPAPQPVSPVVPQASSPPAASYNSNGPAKPLGSSAGPF